MGRMWPMMVDWFWITGFNDALTMVGGNVLDEDFHRKIQSSLAFIHIESVSSSRTAPRRRVYFRRDLPRLRRGPLPRRGQPSGNILHSAGLVCCVSLIFVPNILHYLHLWYISVINAFDYLA